MREVAEWIVAGIVAAAVWGAILAVIWWASAALPY